MYIFSLSLFESASRFTKATLKRRKQQLHARKERLHKSDRVSEKKINAHKQ